MPIHYISRENLKKFRNKTCLLRVDLSVGSGEAKKSLRVLAVLPTLKMLLKNKIKVVILSHRGRPKDREKNLSLRSFAPILSRKLKQKVKFVSDFRIPENGKISIIENLRFSEGEEKNDAGFACRLAKLGDFYVNDAFAVSHRKNASVTAITRLLPSYGGLLLKKEIENLDSAIRKTKKPFVVIIGGAKVGDKLGVINYLWGKADYFLLGSGPAATFFAAQGLPTGESFVDEKSIPKIKKLIGSRKLVLPVDVKIKDKRILDIGEGTTRKYSTLIKEASTIIWNGPLGLFEKKEFEEGSRAMWEAILKNKRAKIVVGGGETLASLGLITNNLQLMTKNKNLFLSTGGGAMLEYLSGRKLPGIEALK